MSRRNIDRPFEGKAMTAVLKHKKALNCGGCVAAVQPHLVDDSSIERPSVDTDNPVLVPAVEGKNLSESEIKRHVSDVGFKVPREIAPELPVEVAEQVSF